MEQGIPLGLAEPGWRRPLAAAALAVGTVLIAGVVLALRLRHSIWFDEAYSVQLASMGLGDIIRELRVDAWPPLYYLALHAWMKVFGSGEWAVRLLSVPCYALGAAAAYAAVREVTASRSAGLLGAALYAANPMALQGAAWTRGYALLGALVAASTWLYLRAFWRERRLGWEAVLFLAVNALGTLTHYWFFFYLAGLGVAGVLFGPRAQRLPLAVAIALSVVPFAVVWAPIFREQLANARPSAWMAGKAVPQLARSLAALTSGGLALVGLAWAAARARDGRPGRWAGLRSLAGDRLPLLLWTTAGLTLLLPLAASALRPVFLARYTVAALGPWIVALAVALWRSGSRRALLVGGALALVSAPAVELAWSREDVAWSDRRMAGHLAGLARPGDAVVFVGVSELGVRYYLERTHPAPRFATVSFPADARLHPGLFSEEAIEGRRRQHQAELRAGLARVLGSPESRVYAVLGSAALDPLVEEVLQEQRVRVDEQQTPAAFFRRLVMYAPREPAPLADPHGPISGR